ncbi:MAG: hypothetical protein HFF04_03165 [Oscillospiraceae bacterium]|nr:hypothetical protein [Oscillospiraceae bacterium]
MGEKRFEKVYSQGMVEVTEIWVDQYTGVNYLWHGNGSSGGLTPLLDWEGKVVITPVTGEAQDQSPFQQW